MFNLEQSIAEWRQQMLAAGIKAPVPLEELEVHLREEIDAQIKSGASELEAFRLASQLIGQAGTLRREFNKMDTGRKIARTVGLAAGWLAAGFALLNIMVVLDLNWNFSDFIPLWNLETATEILGIIVVQYGIWHLAKASCDRATRGISLLVCLYLAAVAFSSVLPPEEITHLTPASLKLTPPDPVMAARLADAFSRHAPSPFWYRGILALLYCGPAISWIYLELRRHVQRRVSRTVIQSD